MKSPDRWPPSRRDPRIDAIPESSWVSVTPALLTIWHADRKRRAEAQSERTEREKQHRTRRSIH